jgi:hypothetical protein
VTSTQCLLLSAYLGRIDDVFDTARCPTQALHVFASESHDQFRSLLFFIVFTTFLFDSTAAKWDDQKTFTTSDASCIVQDGRLAAAWEEILPKL